MSEALGTMACMAYLLRVTVPDRPGALGALAVALGQVNANIMSLNVIETLDGAAVDDIVVDVPTGALPDTLITAAESLDGVSVVSLRPFDGRLGAHQELKLIDQISAAGPDALTHLTQALPGVFSVSWALVLQRDTDGAHMVARGVSAPNDTKEVSVALRPEVGPAQQLDDDVLGQLPQSWTVMDTAVAMANLGEDLVLIFGRIGGPDFLQAELKRIGYFAGIVRMILPQ